eukprot:3520122-Rhodomonas_salina.1
MHVPGTRVVAVSALCLLQHPSSSITNPMMRRRIRDVTWHVPASGTGVVRFEARRVRLTPAPSSSSGRDANSDACDRGSEHARGGRVV